MKHVSMFIRSTSNIIILSCAVIALLTYNFLSAAWTPPIDTPPNSNAEAPIDVSAETQAKAGNFAASIVAATSEMRSARYCDEMGNNCFSDLPACGNGQTLISNNGNWTCGTAVGTTTTGGTSTTSLVNGVHTRQQCTDLGGTVFTSGAEVFCRFNQSSCPSGWTPFQNWSQTTSSQCGVSNCGTSCNPGSHAFNNISPAGEICTYTPGRVSIGKGECTTSPVTTCRSTVTAMGCY